MDKVPCVIAYVQNNLVIYCKMGHYISDRVIAVYLWR